ncbi:MAG: hypothetical protein JW892_05350 [Anaerolineae bacterium]|nr:hypothetical protein [Anaerolineae bacterium]
MRKTLDAKLEHIRKNPECREFILVYAADADMAYGIPAPGATYPPHPGARYAYPSIQDFYLHLEELVREEAVEVLLASVSAMDVLAREKRLFDDSPVTPAVRANDTTDIWVGRGARYAQSPSRPFATTTLEEARFGILQPAPGQTPDVNLGLYSVTFNNDLDADLRSLEAFKAFRISAVRAGFRYFLEVFNPNSADLGLAPEQVPHYVNDQIARMLAGIPRASRPEFLKVAYNGPAAMEELAHYDSSLVVGILGGSSSTSYDAFKLISEAQRHGARLALFGRRIKNAEHPLSLMRMLRAVVDGAISPEEAVRAYRGELERLGIPPRRSLEEDMQLHSPGLL